MEIRIGDLAKRSGCVAVTIRYIDSEDPFNRHRIEQNLRPPESK